MDLIPKFIMANGKLVKMLLHTKVTKYLEWKCVDASYVAQHKKKGWVSKEKMAIAKVPATDQEALKSSLMGLIEKKNCINFYKYVDDVDLADESTWKKRDLNTMSIEDIFKHYKLGANTVDFLGHAVALHTNDDYL